MPGILYVSGIGACKNMCTPTKIRRISRNRNHTRGRFPWPTNGVDAQFLPVLLQNSNRHV